MKDQWAVIVPIRALAQAKSRLDVGEGGSRARFAVAFLLDTISALRGCPRVGSILVVTPDYSLSSLVDCPIVYDDGSGIDQAVSIGRAMLVKRRHYGPVAVVLPDVPALRSIEVGEVLNSLQHNRNAFVSDTDLTGTTCVTASSADTLSTTFGVGSAERHRSLGHRELLLDVPSVRRDVDTIAQLAHARELGLGRETSELLDTHLQFRRELVATTAQRRDAR